MGFQILIKDSKGERWVDAEKVYAHLTSLYLKKQNKPNKPLPYAEKIEKFYSSIDESWKGSLKEAYPNIDIDLQLKESKSWLLSNTHRAKSRLDRFINNWLKKAVDSAKAQPTKIDYKYDTSGNSVILWCETCNKSDFYNPRANPVYNQDSKCCNSKLLTRKKVINEQ
tara:strand:- start:801 stop:1304 length:504 start_codon:yes stop_codon:yes gene_type:complete